MDRETKLLTVALVLMLAAFPVTSVGTTEDQPIVWWIGLVLLAAGALIGPIMRYALPEEGGDDTAADEAADDDSGGDAR